MPQLIIKPNDIPRLTALNGNIDIDKLTPYVFQAQTIDIKRILRTELYDKIVSDYATNTLTGVYKTLYDDYIILVLAYYSASYFISFGSYQIVNNGIMKMASEGTTAVEMKDVQFLSEKYKALGIGFESELYDYLQTIEIPEYDRNTGQKLKNKSNWY
jgi:hypothetical protein